MKICNCTRPHIFLHDLMPGKKHRRFLRWEDSYKKLLTSKLDAVFYSYLSAVLNGYENIIALRKCNVNKNVVL